MRCKLITLIKDFNIFQHEIGGQDYTDGCSISYFINFHFSNCPICHSALPVGLFGWYCIHFGPKYACVPSPRHTISEDIRTCAFVCWQNVEIDNQYALIIINHAWHGGYTQECFCVWVCGFWGCAGAGGGISRESSWCKDNDSCI